MKYNNKKHLLSLMLCCKFVPIKKKPPLSWWVFLGAGRGNRVSSLLLAKPGPAIEAVSTRFNRRSLRVVTLARFWAFDSAIYFKRKRPTLRWVIFFGAGRGNRTPTSSLARTCSTIKPYLLGASGQNRTDYACLFRATLYQWATEALSVYIL